MTARHVFLIFAILVPFFTVFLHCQSIKTSSYIHLIKDVRKRYRSSCVFFVQSGSFEDIQVSTVMHSWSREFSTMGILTRVLSFSKVLRSNQLYVPRIVRPLYVVQMNNKKALEDYIRLTAKMKQSMSYPVWLLLFMEDRGQRTLEDICRNPTWNIFNVNFSTRMLVLCYDWTVLREWYAVEDNITRTFNYASWNPSTGHVIPRHYLSLYSRRSNLFNVTLRIITLKGSRLVSIENNALHGLFGTIFEELSNTLNFSYKILQPEITYGSWSRTEKSWTGVIKRLVKGEADLALGGFTMTNMRLDVVDFSLPLIHSPNRLFIKRPGGAAVQWSAYFQAFDYRIWTAIVLLILLTPLMLTWMKNNTYTSFLKTPASNTFIIMSESYTRVWGIYCQQGLTEFPVRDSLKLAYLSIFISAIIVYGAYSASLISYLTVFIPSMPFTTPEEFIQDGSYKLIVLRDGADYDLFKTSNDKTLSRMWKQMKTRKQLPFTSKEAFDEVCKGNIAFFTTESVKSETQHELTCNTAYIETGRFDSLAITLTKGNPYTGVINYHLQRFQDYGLLNRIKSSHLNHGTESSSRHPAVSLWGIAPILSVVFGGMILGIIVLLAERIYHTFANQEIKSTNKRQVTEKSFGKRRFRKLRQKTSTMQDESFYTARYWP